MHHPHIAFKTNWQKDLRTLRAFTEEAPQNGTRIIQWAILNTYPHLQKFLHKNNFRIINEPAIKSFIKKQYREQDDLMKTQMVAHEQSWKKLAPKFYTLTDQLFPKHPWPPGKYIAYGTIWGMYPRFLHDKTFQIPYTHDKPGYVNTVIAHELLHFIFYDYFFKHFPAFKKQANDMLAWHISEIFNTFVQNSPQWLKIFKVRSMGYPEHAAIVRALRKKFINTGWTIELVIKEITRLMR